MKDPGILIIPFKFGNSTKMNALADCGGSINLMPNSFYKKLDLPEFKTERRVIHMANGSVTYP